MYQLNYHSKSVLELVQEDLENILATSNFINNSRNITGCLIFHNKRFVQILEGKKKDVLEVYDKIKADNRHHNVTLLWENNVDKRYFPEWNMAFHKPENENLKQHTNNLMLLSSLSDTSTGSLLSFWATVRKILSDGKNNHLKKI
ncbi:BLUF domain-containing protein [Olleya aquimaris]|uniref:FAD-dependent sensor of blue light n=1 Tax=Olleya aquimaris TaxID=639310 RepID=A0A327RMA0_9FLAO|nr:BLUF domain-containing protein [Olleya aquimaris]RAJ17022.1 FAD-dependent sensor of blue light [Olleya aquimaris]